MKKADLWEIPKIKRFRCLRKGLVTNMENDKNNNRGDARRENRNGTKKPFYKHYRRKSTHNKSADRTGDTTEHGGEINTSHPRYDTPPTVAQSAASFTSPTTTESTVNNSEGKDNRRPYNRHKKGRRDNWRQTNTPEISAENAEALELNHGTDLPEKSKNGDFDSNRRRRKHQRSRSHGEFGERVDSAATESAAAAPVIAEEDSSFTEYITTAGNINEEIVEEINSISQNELENLDFDEVEEPLGRESNEELARYEIVGIRFKTGGKIYYFAPGDFVCTKGEAIIVETSRGLEYGVCDIPNRTVTEREIVLPLRPVIRKATDEDTEKHEYNSQKEQEALAVCQEKILEHKLGMKLIDVEYAFDASKLLFYFTAEGRVDFRELVKDLAAAFHTRIELRQIGIRDETKLLGGIGICGRPFCCKTFLSDFVQVSIKMAKEQNLSLNSAKISGACGRLMCCLRYEHDVYQEEIKKTPKVDQIVETPDGDGTVIEVQPLAGLVRVRFGSKQDMIVPKVYHRDEVKVIGGKGVKPKEQ